MVICSSGNDMAVDEGSVQDAACDPKIPKLDSVFDEFFSVGVGSLNICIEVRDRVGKLGK